MGILKDLAKGKMVLIVYPNNTVLSEKGKDLVLSIPGDAVYSNATRQVRVEGGGVASLYRAKDLDANMMAGLYFQSIYISQAVNHEDHSELATGTVLWLFSKLRGRRGAPLKLVYMKEG